MNSRTRQEFRTKQVTDVFSSVPSALTKSSWSTVSITGRSSDLKLNILLPLPKNILVFSECFSLRTKQNSFLTATGSCRTCTCFPFHRTKQTSLLSGTCNAYEINGFSVAQSTLKCNAKNQLRSNNLKFRSSHGSRRNLIFIEYHHRISRFIDIEMRIL